MKILNNKGMERLEKIQDKYKFQNTFELESEDVYSFCSDIRKAFHLGLNLEEKDLEFIEKVLDELYD